MAIVLDHVTQFVHDRDVAAKALRALGLNAVQGGIHPGVGSANNLCYFGLFYIELLSLLDSEEAAHGPSAICRQAVDFLKKGEGLGNLAFETTDIEPDLERMRRAGLKVDEPVRMQRVHPDGFVSLSRIAYPTSPTPPPIPVPILIQRDLGPESRERDLRSRGVIKVHEAGDLLLDHVALCTSDIEAACRFLNERFGLTTAHHFYDDEALNARCCRLEARRGDIVLCSPKGAGLVMDQLSFRGPGPFMLAFRSAAAAETRRWMRADARGWIKPERAHGARIRILED